MSITWIQETRNNKIIFGIEIYGIEYFEGDIVEVSNCDRKMKGTIYFGVYDKWSMGFYIKWHSKTDEMYNYRREVLYWIKEHSLKKLDV